MRVATFNVRHGRPNKGFASNRRLAAACAGLDSDIIGLQELECRVVRSWFANQLAAIASATGSSGVYAPARRLGLTGTGGIGLCVRGAVLRSEILSLPHHPGDYQRVA